MNNRRGTPSGDGRGRGRGGAPGGASGARGGAGSRGGSGGFRGAGGPRGGAQGGSWGGSRGGSDRRDAFRSDERPGASGRGASERGSYERGASERGASERGSYERGSYDRGASDRGSYDRGASSGGDDRGFRPREGFRGGYRDSGAAPQSSRGRFGRPGGDDRRGSFRDDRAGSSGGDRRGSFSDDRGGSARGGSYGGDRAGSSRGDRGGSFRGGSSGGDRPTFSREDDRGSFRAGRGGSRERYGRDETGRDRPGREEGRYQGDSRGGSRGGYEGRDRRDEVQTIGRVEGPSRGRYGRPEPGRTGGQPGRSGGQPGRTGGQSGRTGGQAGRPGGLTGRGGAPAGRGKATRGGAPAGGGFAGRGQADRPERAGAFKTSRQPLRDPDFFPSDYVDERDTTEVPDGIRLQKVLAQAGVAARRTCEEMIGEGRVTVDGQVVRRFGARVDPAKQIIHVDGKRIPTAPDLVYFAINKPIGVVSTMSDPEGRPALSDYVADRTERLFHVGRLDTETEGLIILTNDGELAHRLTHPSFGVQKKYWAKVPGPIPRDLARRLKSGVELEDGVAKADDFKIVQEHGQQALVEIVLHEGRKHVVRRMLEQEGHNVIDLARIEFGPVKLGRLKPGTVRSLTLKEVGDLYAVVGM
ncbi:pseudouridine synthase [Sphaerisporangium sp. NPDC049002]|uniref:pseudouridine synthase n=1 Tax=Sphaerisporangium sp. NPDC049002 TaxID=3155392 RepID=UPI0034117606